MFLAEDLAFGGAKMWKRGELSAVFARLGLPDRHADPAFFFGSS